MSEKTTQKKVVKPMVRAGEESPQLTDEMIDQTRELIGVWLRRDVHIRNIYEPLSVQDIRRWALYSVGDDNPLWHDVGYGKETAWGSVIAPPTFLLTVDSGIIAPGLGGIQWIGAGHRWEHFLPVRAGDTITSRARLIDVQIREGSNVPRYVNQVGEVLYINQYDQLVARLEADTFRIPRKRSGGGFKFAVKEEKDIPKPYKYSVEEIEEIAEAYRTEEVRGAKPRYWEDVKVGDQLDPVTKGPLCMSDMIAFYAGAMVAPTPAHGMALKDRKRHPGWWFRNPENGGLEPIIRVHENIEAARAAGIPAPYDAGVQRHSWLLHLVTNWMGDDAFLVANTGNYTAFNYFGDVTYFSGEVVRKYESDGDMLVDLEIRGTNQNGVVSIPGTATVALPSRNRPGEVPVVRFNRQRTTLSDYLKTLPYAPVA